MTEHDEEKEPDKDKIRIYVNNRPVEMPSDDATGAQIKHHAGVPADFKLYGPDGEPIGDAKKVELKRDERFTAISGQDVS